MKFYNHEEKINTETDKEKSILFIKDSRYQMSDFVICKSWFKKFQNEYQYVHNIWQNWNTG